MYMRERERERGGRIEREAAFNYLTPSLSENVGLGMRKALEKKSKGGAKE